MIKKKKTLDIVISVFVAILLWAYVLNVVNPPTTQTIKDVPVQLQHAEVLGDNKLAIAGDGLYTVDVVVEGPRALLSGFDESMLVATADLIGVSAGQNYVTVDVRSSDAAVTVQDVHSQKIQIYVDEFVEAEKPLNVAYGALDGDFEILILTVETENVVVSGAKSLVDLVSEVRVDVDSSILETDKFTKEKLAGVPLDSEGNIVNAVKLSSEEIGVTLARLAVKEIPLNVKTTGTPGLNASVSSVKVPSKIRIKGTGAALAGISSLTAEPINVDGLVSNATVNLKYSLPSGVYLADSQEPLRAVVSLADSASVAYEYTTEDIVFLNLADGLTVRLVDQTDAEGNVIPVGPVRISVSGSLEAVKSISRESVLPALDLSSIQAGELSLSLGSIYTNGDLSISAEPAIINVEVSAVAETPEEPAVPEE